MTQANLHHQVDYTLYEGLPVKGLPQTVVSRGEVVVRDRQFVGQPGRGRFLKRTKYRPGRL
jgi:dihydropyrimidinase